MLCEILKKKNLTNHNWEKKINCTIEWINIYRYSKDQNLKEYKYYTVVLMPM